MADSNSVALSIDSVKSAISILQSESPNFERAFSLIESFNSFYTSSIAVALAIIGLGVPVISFYLTYLSRQRLKINAENIKSSLIKEIQDVKDSLSSQIQTEMEKKLKEMEEKYQALSKMTRNQINIVKTNNVYSQAVEFFRDRKYAPSILLMAKAYAFTRKIENGYPENEKLKTSISEYLIEFVNETGSLSKQEFNPTNAKILDVLKNIELALDQEHDVNLNQIKTNIHGLYDL